MFIGLGPEVKHGHAVRIPNRADIDAFSDARSSFQEEHSMKNSLMKKITYSLNEERKLDEDDEDPSSEDAPPVEGHRVVRHIQSAEEDDHFGDRVAQGSD